MKWPSTVDSEICPFVSVTVVLPGHFVDRRWHFSSAVLALSHRDMSFQHDQGYAQICVGFAAKARSVSDTLLTGRFHQDPLCPVHKLVIRLGQINHQVFVGMAESHHRCCREHV